MSKKRMKALTPDAPEKAESRAVLAIRIPLQMRDRLRAVAGWGRQQQWVTETLMAAIEKAEKK